MAKQSFTYAALILWGVASMLATFVLFFPYQKALAIFSQNLLGSSNLIVSLQGTHFGFSGARASSMVVRHIALEGRPVVELQKIDARWNPLSLLTGKFAMLCRALAYEGILECSVVGIPLFSKGNPSLNIKFVNINLAKYPEQTLPWCTALKGKLSGWVKDEVPLENADKQKGSFRVTLKSGEINNLQVQGMGNVVLPYSQVLADGRIVGSKIYLDKIVVDGKNIVLRGNGSIDRLGSDPTISLKLACEGTSGTPPFTNGSVIAVSGKQWHPTITVSTESGQKKDKPASTAGLPLTDFHKSFRKGGARPALHEEGATYVPLT